MCKVVLLVAAFIGCASATVLGENEGASAGSRIMNGNLAAEGQFPYMASLQQIQVTPTDIRGHRCGGVMVTLQHMVTAASCLFDTAPNGSPTLINPGQFRVFAGSTILTNDNVAERIRQITNITIHPNFMFPPAHVNDIAVIWLNTPYLNTTVVPLQLFPNATTFNPENFRLCSVIGWGATNNTASASPQQRFATKYIYDQNLCTFLHNNIIGSANVLTSMICATSFDIISVGCTGDIGNPLVCDNILTGILFKHSDFCMPTSQPELYTRMSNYTAWIHEVTGSSSTLSPGIFMLMLWTIVQFITIKL